MPPTIINKKASNWVDRGESPHATIERVLARFLGHNSADQPIWFRQQSEALVGMVAADATEVHLTGFLRTLLPNAGAAYDSATIRAAAISIWHIAKAALVRDFAERVVSGEVPANTPTQDSLSHWLASRLLTPEQLDEFERKADAE
jgi:hypothetical protein